MRSQKCPLTIDKLIGFEDYLMSLIKNIEFCIVSNTFREQLANDIKRINCTNKIILPAEKIRNLYKVEKEDYKKYLKDNTTEIYKKQLF